MNALAVFLTRVFNRSGSRRLDSDAQYPDASKAIEEFNTRLTQRIAAQRARSEGTRTPEYREQVVSG